MTLFFVLPAECQWIVHVIPTQSDLLFIRDLTCIASLVWPEANVIDNEVWLLVIPSRGKLGGGGRCFHDPLILFPANI